MEDDASSAQEEEDVPRREHDFWGEQHAHFLLEQEDHCFLEQEDNVLLDQEEDVFLQREQDLLEHHRRVCS